MRIYYEKGLKREAKWVRKVLYKIYCCFDVKLIEKDLSYFFKFVPEVGYVLKGLKRLKKPVVLLTKKEIHLWAPGEHDWMFGMHSEGTVIISMYRLKVKEVKKYRTRVEFMAMHELAHYYFKEPKHFKHYPALGKHCPCPKCVSSYITTMENLDKNIERKYKKWFCKNCRVILNKVREKNLEKV